MAVDRFTASALTHLLVVRDAQASRDWYVRVLDASVYGEYGGTSVVLDLMGTWILLVTGGEPTPDKPTVTLTTPDEPDRASAEIIFRVDDCRATYNLLHARGAEFLAEPYDWGSEIRAFFRDPDGHLFEISQLIGGSGNG
jgi:catechol 2,3-dioxygenase-like lactoylglutathione lyase family enzyme